jgi:hypothetical protein
MKDKLSKSALTPKSSLMVNIGNPEDSLRRQRVGVTQRDSMEGGSKCHTS